MEGGKEANYWPGFVDALSNVVLTLVFVLVIFVFALMMASNKVAKKMQEVEASEKAQQVQQVQLNQALSELEKLRQGGTPGDPGKPAGSSATDQEQACLRFNKSDTTQKATIDRMAESILITFGPGAITVTEETAKVMREFLEAYREASSGAKFAIESSEDPSSTSPLLARETQLGRMLNIRNTLLDNKIEPRNIAVHNIAPLKQEGSYDWVKVYVPK